MITNKFLFITFLFIVLGTFSYAQGGALTDSKKLASSNPYEISVFVGLASYEGDIVSFKDKDVNLFNSAGAAFGFNFNYNISSNLSAGLGYRYGKIKGDDSEADFASGRRAKGFSFTNNLNEITLRIDYAPLAHKGHKLTPYIYSAIGVLLSNPDVSFKETVAASRIQKDKNEISKTSVVFPLGFGIKYQINTQYTLRAEAALRVGANDYIDGVSHSASTKHNDYYGMGGISLGYSFGKSKNNFIKEI